MAQLDLHEIGRCVLDALAIALARGQHSPVSSASLVAAEGTIEANVVADLIRACATEDVSTFMQAVLTAGGPDALLVTASRASTWTPQLAPASRGILPTQLGG